MFDELTTAEKNEPRLRPCTRNTKSLVACVSDARAGVMTVVGGPQVYVGHVSVDLCRRYVAVT